MNSRNGKQTEATIIIAVMARMKQRQKMTHLVFA